MLNRGKTNGGNKMSVVSMKQLLEAGVHFGHTTKRWDPKMAKYIYTARNGIYIIDLKKTAEEIERAYQALFSIVADGGSVLFVGTKKQAQEAVFEEATRTGQFYVNQRWLGGTLTNFNTIRRRIKRLKDLYEMEENGTFANLPKKEVVGLIKERDRLEKFLSGIKNMQKLPEALYIVDPKKEINAIREARILGIPVFGIVDTNCDPDDVDYVIPANDDAIRAVKLITHILGNAIIEAQGGIVEKYEDDDEVDLDTSEDSKGSKPMTSYQSPEDEVKGDEKAVKPEVKKEEKVVAKEEKPKTVEIKQPEVKEVKKVKEKEKAVKPEVKEVKKVEEKEKVVKPKVKTDEKAAVKEDKPEVKEKAVKPEVVKKDLEEPKKEDLPAKQEKQAIDLESLKVVELRKLAKEKNIPGYSSMKKAELIEALK